MLGSFAGRRDVRTRFGDPLVVGGTGGSGTRSVVQLLVGAGMRMGSRLNAEWDAESLSSYYWQYGRPLLEAALASDSPGPHVPGAARALRRGLVKHLRGVTPSSAVGWGWKHPDSLLLLPELRREFPALRFVHVVRDGRDIAFSGNQRQTRRYGPILTPGLDSGPVGSAAYWSAANLYAASVGSTMGDAYRILRLEDLCARPVEETHALLVWAGLLTPETSPEAVEWARSTVKAPASLGRWQTSGYEKMSEITTAAAPGLLRFGYP